MAFSVECFMFGYEFRGVSAGTSKAGKAYRAIRVESPDGRTAEISCTDPVFFAAIDMLQKGSIYDFHVRCVAGRERSYIILLSAPVPPQV